MFQHKEISVIQHSCFQNKGKQPHDHFHRFKTASDKNSTPFHDKNTQQTKNRRIAFSANIAGNNWVSLYAKIPNLNLYLQHTHTKFMMYDSIYIKY